MRKFLSLLLLTVFVLTSTLCVDAAVVNSGSRSVHLGSRSQTIHVSVRVRKHHKHKKHKKHHKRKHHRKRSHRRKTR